MTWGFGSDADAHTPSVPVATPTKVDDTESTQPAADVAKRQQSTNPSGDLLTRRCEQRAVHVSRQLGKDAKTLIRAPFVLASPMSRADLEQLYNDVIHPTTQALQTAYFDRLPDEPITLVVFSREARYREYAQRVDRRPMTGYYGYYLRDERRVVINLATGHGTLAHELTHALSHFDFAKMPEWFDEGLASLHEECEFTTDGLKLLGLPNWRLAQLRQALENGRMLTLTAFTTSPQVRIEEKGIDYAHGRYLCLYLQSRGVLGDFYRKYRTNYATDPYGHRSLCQVLHVNDLDAVQAMFLDWIDEQ
ncbi:MAG: hypothetical protein CMJ78_27735 [Planctomycetaceae bacterium]|nr:hypothetical protein [Planctomycetaceae bacterium]